MGPGIEEIRRLLDALRRKARRAAALHGLAVVATACCGGFLAWFLADWIFRLEWGHRLVVFLAAAAGLVVLVRRVLVTPLATPMSDEDLALVLEKRVPALGCRLISAVQFSRLLTEGRAPFSPVLAADVMEQARRDVAGLDVSVVLDRARLRRGFRRAALAAAGAALLLLLFPTAGRIWLLRNVLLMDLDWPHRTVLVLEDFPDGRRRVAQGEDVVVRARVIHGEIPDRGALHFRTRSGVTGRVEVSVTSAGVFKGVLEELVEDADVTVRAGDGCTSEGRLLIVPRPEIAELAFDVAPPAYTGRPRRTLTGSGLDLTIPLGTELTVRGAATKDLRRFWITVPPGDAAAEGSVEGRRFRSVFRPATSGFLAMGLEDGEGLTCADPVKLPLRVVPDRAPQVGLRLEGIGERITARAVIPLHVTLRDDYGVAGATLEHVVEIRTAEGPVERPGRRPLAGLAGGTADQTLEDRLETQGLGLEPGVFLRIRVTAVDGDTLHGPNEGRSDTLALKVVTAQELYAELLERQQEQRRALEQILETEQAVGESFDEVTAAPGPDGSLDETGRETLSAVVRDQRGIQGRVLLVADQMERILAELLNNGLGEEKEHQHIRWRIVEPLRALAGGPVEANLTALIQVFGAHGEEGFRERSRAAAQGFPAILRAMRAVLQDMLKQESYSEIVAALRTLLRSQQELLEGTEREHRRALEELLDPGGKKKDDEKGK